VVFENFQHFDIFTHMSLCFYFPWRIFFMHMTCLFLGSAVAFVRDSTCVHMRALGPNIYMYRRGEIYKETPGQRHRYKSLMHI
jgi:hypothetical protein